MPNQIHPVHVLRLIDATRLDEGRNLEVVKHVGALHVCRDRHHENVELAPGEKALGDEACEWFSYWWFDDKPFNAQSLAQFADRHFIPKIRSLAPKYSDLGDAAIHYDQPPQPFVNMSSIILGLADNLIVPQGSTHEELARDGLKILCEFSVGGSPAHVAANSAMRLLEHAAERRLEEKTNAMDAREALELREGICEKIVAGHKRLGDLAEKWPQGALASLPVPQRREYENDWHEQKTLQNRISRAQRHCVILMNRIVELLPSFQLDPTPARSWLVFTERTSELDARLSESTVEEYDRAMKQCVEDCKFDSDKLSLVLNKLWDQVSPITAERFADLSGMDVKHVRRAVRDGKLTLTRDEASKRKQRRESKRSQERKMDEVAMNREQSRPLARSARYGCTSCPWKGTLKPDQSDCPDCGKAVKLITGTGARK